MDKLKMESRDIVGGNVEKIAALFRSASHNVVSRHAAAPTMAKLLPTHLVIRDASAANDNVLDNFDQIIESYSNEKKITPHII